MNKKAVRQNIVAGLIIGAFVIIILSVFAVRYQQTIAEDNARITCAQSVRNFAFNAPLIEKLTDSITCPTKYVTLKQDPSVKKEDEEIKKQLADTLLESFQTFGKGELQLFDEEGTFCAIYEVVAFSEADKKIFDFEKFLKEKKARGVLNPAGDGSYAAQLIPIIHGVDISSTTFEDMYSSFVIDTNKKYAVYFVYLSKEGAIEVAFSRFFSGDTIETGGIGTAGGAVIGGVVGGPIGLVIGGVAGGLLGAAANLIDHEKLFASFVVLDEYNTDVITKLGCKELSIKQNQKPSS